MSENENPFELPVMPPPEPEGSQTIHTDDTLLPQEPISNKLGQKHHPDSGHRISVVYKRLGDYIARLAIKERKEIKTPNTIKQLGPNEPPSKN